MNLQFRLILVLVFFCLFHPTSVGAETSETEYSYKKGQVVDFLFLIQEPDTQELLQRYFTEAISIAADEGYEPLPGFRTKQTPTQGNFKPDHVAIGAWSSWNQRDRALEKLETRLPDFHQWRREIWSTFALSIYEMPEDVSFVLSSDNVYVLTAYWAKDSKAFASFEKKWLRKAKKAGGKVELELKDAKSPFGYYHSPDSMTITRWENQEVFDRFLELNRKMDHGAVRHVNQFRVQAPNPRKK